MNHRHIQEALSAYLDNELSASMRARVETHLHSCGACSETLAAFQRNRDSIKGLVHPAPPIKDGVMAKIHEQLQGELSAHLDNELAPDVQKRVETHLHACTECSETLAAFQQNRERVKGLEHRAPSSIQDAVMAQVRQRAAMEKPSRTLQLPDIGGWLLDFGRWFSRPATAGATGLVMFVLILGSLYFYPNGSQYEETFDFYFGLHAEQTDNPLYSSDSIGSTDTSLETDGDTEIFFNLYLENVGN